MPVQSARETAYRRSFYFVRNAIFRVERQPLPNQRARQPRPYCIACSQKRIHSGRDDLIDRDRAWTPCNLHFTRKNGWATAVISGPLSFGIVSGNLSLSEPPLRVVPCHVDVQFRGNPCTFYARVPCRHAFPLESAGRPTVTVKSRETFPGFSCSMVRLSSRFVDPRSRFRPPGR